MSAREEILSRIRSSIRERYDKPSMDDLSPISWEDPVGQFVSALESTGGRAVELPDGACVNDIIKGLFPDAGSIASNLDGISVATMDPDLLEDAGQMGNLDVGIVRGEIGVAENACVWVPQTMKEKAVCFICEHLVILLDKGSIVSNMHEAYRRINFTDYGFGTFISGPSKTADIAQVLVMGAQAARSLTVILTGGTSLPASC